MSTATTTIRPINDLAKAEAGSWYTIRGAGGDLAEWVTGITELWEKEGVGTPAAFYRTTGATVNAYAGGPDVVAEDDRFKDDLTILLIPLDGLDVGRLAILRLRMGDAWFDDVVANMRRGATVYNHRPINPLD